jgi:hypothetical protein
MDTTCWVGTDIAGFFLYEPEALQHRAQDPWMWFADYGDQGSDLGELTVPERTDGRLILIDTSTPCYDDDDMNHPHWVGSDGGYRFRCTTGGLTRDEAIREYPEMRDARAVETIRVTRHRLLLDGGYLIPCEKTGVSLPSPERALEQHLVTWLSLPNGTYRVTVYHLAPSDEDDPDRDEVDIVLIFTLVSP